MRRLPSRLVFWCFMQTLLLLGLTGSGMATAPPMFSRDFALSRCNGQVLPAATTAPPVAPPAIYVGSVGARLSAFSPLDGSSRWCNQFSLKRPYLCPPGAHCPGPPPVVVGQPLLVRRVLYVCVSGYSGMTYAFNASNGALRWQRETGCSMDSVTGTYAQPILANGLLYTGNDALDLDTGAIRWQMPLEASIGTVMDGVMYAYSDETVYALAASSCAVRWQYQLPAPISVPPTVAEGKVYVGDLNGDSPPAVTLGLPDAHALDARTGAPLWSYPSGIVSSIAVDETHGLVYVGASSDGPGSALFALDATTGELHWKYSTGLSTISAPHREHDVLYLTADGAYALNAQDGTLRWHNALFAKPVHRFYCLGSAGRDAVSGAN